jgi:hypothetical protein
MMSKRGTYRKPLSGLRKNFVVAAYVADSEQELKFLDQLHPRVMETTIKLED